MTRIAVLGDRELALLTHRELDATLARVPDGVEAEWVGTDAVDGPLAGVDGLWVDAAADR
jgi:hypothetical protein